MNIQDAQPTDSLQRDNLFYSDNWHFIATCLITNPLIQVKAVVSHPVKIGQRLFYLSPFSVCNTLWQQYRNGELNVEPQSLAQMVNEVRKMEVTEKVLNNQPTYTDTQYLTPSQRKDLEEIKNRKHISGNELMGKAEGGGR